MGLLPCKEKRKQPDSSFICILHDKRNNEMYNENNIICPRGQMWIAFFILPETAAEGRILL